MHKIIKCSKCHTTITQCRCPALDKEVEYQICGDCEKGQKHLPSPNTFQNSTKVEIDENDNIKISSPNTEEKHKCTLLSSGGCSDCSTHMIDTIFNPHQSSAEEKTFTVNGRCEQGVEGCNKIGQHFHPQKDVAEWEKEFDTLISDKFVDRGVNKNALKGWITGLLATQRTSIMEELRKVVEGDDDAVDTLEEIINRAKIY